MKRRRNHPSAAVPGICRRGRNPGRRCWPGPGTRLRPRGPVTQSASLHQASRLACTNVAGDEIHCASGRSATWWSPGIIKKCAPEVRRPTTEWPVAAAPPHFDSVYHCTCTPLLFTADDDFCFCTRLLLLHKCTFCQLQGSYRRRYQRKPPIRTASHVQGTALPTPHQVPAVFSPSISTTSSNGRATRQPASRAGSRQQAGGRGRGGGGG